MPPWSSCADALDEGPHPILDFSDLGRTHKIFVGLDGGMIALEHAIRERKVISAPSHRSSPPYSLAQVKGQSMPIATARANAAKSPIRARVEHVFAHQKNRFGLLGRTIGIPGA